MNLADAIRKASTEGAQVAPQAPNVEQNKEQADGKININSVSPSAPTGSSPDEPSYHINSGNVVRLELFLSAEQMSGLFRAIMAGQHTVMTSREAASYLRISKDKLEKLAEEGEIPGVVLDGRWRFPKPNLDDWLTLQTVGHDEEEEDVA